MSSGGEQTRGRDELRVGAEAAAETVCESTETARQRVNTSAKRGHGHKGAGAG